MRFQRKGVHYTTGEAGDVFYIIEEGEAMAFGSKDHGKAAIPEMNYTKGNYCGELLC